MEKGSPVVVSSARKHGVVDEDILHAYRNATHAWELDDGLMMLVGPDRSARLLEVGFVRGGDGTHVIVHAMTVRSKFVEG